MTKTEIISRVRTALLDTNSSAYRWTADEMASNMDDAIRAVRSDRPETRYDSDGRLRDEVYSSDNILLDDHFKEPIVYYMLHKCYLKDDTDTVNEQNATRYFQLYQTSVMK